MMRTLRRYAVLLLVFLAIAPAAAQEPRGFDLILDTYVRDGEVYYRALKLERARLDAYISQIATSPADKGSREERLAFWLNAYNALVLKTVVDHYPIQGKSTAYPARSIRQIPGAFDKLTHRVAGRTMTLDQIEQTVLPEFKDPRVYLALGRGAQGGGRLRSEAYAPQTIDAQLTAVARECVTRKQCVVLNRDADVISVSAIFSWREPEFTAAYANAAPATFSARSPLERAVIAFVQPTLLTIEKDFLARNTFRVAFSEFDWTLNDLTGRGGR